MRAEARETDYDAEVRLPDSKTCADCQHVTRCVAFGFTEAHHQYCDFHPSRYRPVAEIRGLA